MTALARYQRLESGGIWRASAEAQRRDVILSFGDATLVISASTGRALSHWSLPAVERLNLGTRPALFSPDTTGDESVEIADAEMIEAIEKVRKTVAKSRPHPGRLRLVGLGLSAAMVAALAVFWLPDALMRQTLSAVPPVKRTEIGATLLGYVQALTGPACRAPDAAAALPVLQRRVLGPDAPGQIVILPGGPPGALYLPGGIITLNRAVVEDQEDPNVAAGHIIAAAATIRVDDPLGAILRQAGTGAAFHLYTTGDLPPGTLRAYSEALLADPPLRAGDAVLIESFAAAELPTTPYAYALDMTGESTLGLIEADPMLGQTPPAVLSDAQWVALQGICGA